MTLKVFSAEAEAGLEELILQDTIVKTVASIKSLKHASKEDIENETDEQFARTIAKANPDQIDLYYLESILVSTVWNKNDDVFLPEPTWAARHTPEDKQFNYMHDDDDIIGHITGSYVEDFYGNLIPDDTPEDKIPSEFNIVTQAVIYTARSNPETKERIDEIIDSIERGEGKWKVSMECLFPHFDYAALNKETGEFKIIPRNESSASLSKHLRVYGGSGEYGKWKIGRALRGLTFSGKGLVDNPANERSDIRKEKTEVVTIASDNFAPEYRWGKNYMVTASDKNSGTFADISETDKLENQENKMSEDLTKRIAQLETELSEAKKDKEEMKKKMDEQKYQETKALISQHEDTIASKDSDIASLQKELDDAKAALDTAKSDLEKANEEKAEAQKAIAQLEEEKTKAERKAELVKVGASEDEAQATVEEWLGASDEQFSKVVKLTEAAYKNKSEEEEAMKKKGKASDDVEDEEGEDASESLDNIEDDETSQASLNSNEDDSKSGNKLSKSLANYFINQSK